MPTEQLAHATPPGKASPEPIPRDGPATIVAWTDCRRCNRAVQLVGLQAMRGAPERWFVLVEVLCGACGLRDAYTAFAFAGRRVWPSLFGEKG